MYVITDRSINDNGCATGMECHRGGNKARSGNDYLGVAMLYHIK